jgi:hypothetical protein
LFIRVGYPATKNPASLERRDNAFPKTGTEGMRKKRHSRRRGEWA